MILSILLQTSTVIIAVWIVARLATRLSVDAKAWLWRIALLKPLVCLLPFMLVPIAVLKGAEKADTIAPIASRSLPISTSPTSSSGTSRPFETPIEVPWAALWIAGSGSLALFGLASLMRTRKMAASCAPILNRDIHLSASQLCRAGGLEQTLSIAESDLVKTPMLITLGKPTLVLPSCLVRDASSEDIRAILAHEIAHFVRRDPLWTTLGWISRTLFFFNPFVWIAAHCSRVANESATDYLACQLAKISPSNYAGMLLRSTVVVRKMEPVGALHLSGPLKTMHRRLEAMKHFNNKPNAWQKLVGFTTVAAVIGLLPLYQLAEAQDKKPAAPASPSPKAPAPVAPKAPSSVPGVPGTAPSAPIIVNRSGTSPASAPQPGQPVAPAQAGSQSTSNSTSSTGGTSVPGSAAMPALPSGGVNIPGMPAMPASSGGGKTSSASGSASSQSSSSGSASSGGSSSSGGSNGSRSGNSSQNSQSSNNSNRSQDSQSSNSSDSSKSNSSQSSQNSQGAGIFVPPAMVGQQRGSSGSVSGQQTQDGMLLTFKFENFSFQKAIQALFDQVGKKVRFEGETLNTVTGSVKNATFDQALKTLLTAGKLEMKMDNGVAVIRPINFGERILP